LPDTAVLRGRTIDGMLSAAVYTANELDIKIPLVDPLKYVVKVANILGINEKTKKQAMSVENEVAVLSLYFVFRLSSAGQHPAQQS
jgi:transcription initiation factor TFIIIB Brf1 subunit/transcription initiation factor TFIIB